MDISRGHEMLNSRGLHITFMCDGVYCEPHYRATHGKSHYTFAHMVYHSHCSLIMGCKLG